MTESRPVLVRLEDIGKRYPKVSQSSDRLRALWSALRRQTDGPAHVILDGIDLEVRRGESLGVIGENGAGKSTLLKTIAGVLTPTRGRIQVNGRVGALLELGAGFHPEYTGRENIRLAAALMGLHGDELERKLPEIVAFADIGDYIDEPTKHYSSGMVVRLGFALITVADPELLITDEVLAVGDESFQKKCIRWMENYLANGGTLLLCSHSMFHIQKLCRHACWIHHGRIRRYGDAFEVTREYLAYHESKTRNSDKDPPRAMDSGADYRVASLWLMGQDEDTELELPMGADLEIIGRLYSPDDRAPVVAVGIVRANDVPVYGVTSDTEGFQPNRLEPGCYGFAMILPNLALLPGKYTLRVHALDPEGLRVFDTVERAFYVVGRTRELGFCRLPHAWSPHGSPAG